MQTIIEKAVSGDAEAFLELIDQNSLSMYKAARAILNCDANVADAVQETILSCYENLHTLKQPEYFKTWLIRILINHCNRIRKLHKREHPAEEMPEPAGHDPLLAEFEFKEMLNLMDEKYRLILILYYLEGFKIPEIAGLLEMKENTVKTRLARARKQIRTAYLENH